MFRVIGYTDLAARTKAEKESHNKFFKKHEERVEWVEETFAKWQKKLRQLPLSQDLSSPESAREFLLLAHSQGAKNLELQIKVKKRNKSGGGAALQSHKEAFIQLGQVRPNYRLRILTWRSGRIAGGCLNG